MDVAIIQELARMTLMNTLMIAGPILMLAMVVGLTMGVFQSITSIQETTVAFVPKMLAVGGSLLVLMPWMLDMLAHFAMDLFGNLGRYAQ
jgi:flagellar biosynthetic protein FliQ